MAAVSKNKYDVYVWILNVIDSVNGKNHIGEQADCCRNLIKNFYTLYKDEFLRKELKAAYWIRFPYGNDEEEEF